MAAVLTYDELFSLSQEVSNANGFWVRGGDFVSSSSFQHVDFVWLEPVQVLGMLLQSL